MSVFHFSLKYLTIPRNYLGTQEPALYSIYPIILLLFRKYPSHSDESQGESSGESQQPQTPVSNLREMLNQREQMFKQYRVNIEQQQAFINQREYVFQQYQVNTQQIIQEQLELLYQHERRHIRLTIGCLGDL